MSRKPATRSTKRSAASVKSPAGGRQAAIWNAQLYDRAVEDDTFIQVFLDGEDLKRRPNNLKLTGAKNMWDKDDKADYVYEPVSRLAGPRDAVEQALQEFEKQIRKVTGDKSSVSDLLKGAYAKGTKSKAYQAAINKAAKEKKAHLKATREAVQEGAFSLAEAEYIYNAFTEGKRGKRGGKSEKAEKTKKPKKTGLLYMLGKARFFSKKDNDEKEEGPYVVDVSDISATGTGAHVIPLSKAQADEDLKTIQNVDDWIIYSSSPIKFNNAMRILADAGAKGYLKYQGKLGQSVSGDLASNYAVRAKEEMKAYKAATAEEASEDEDEDEEEEKPKKKKSTKKTAKKAADEDEDEEEEEKPKKKATKKASKSRSASPVKKTSKAAAPTKKASKSRSASPAKKPASAEKKPTRSASPGKKPAAPAKKSGSTSPRRTGDAVPEPEETSAGSAASTLRAKGIAKPGARKLPTKKPTRTGPAAGSPGADDDE